MYRSINILLISLVLFIPFQLFAAPSPKVEMWGHADCIACVAIKNALRKRGVSVHAHNLKSKKVEAYYVRNFGRGKIPVTRVGSRVIRGDKLDEVLRAVEARKVAVERRNDENAQRCVNGQVLESFYERSKHLLQQKVNPIPNRRDPVDIALDLCYGTNGWLSCGDRSIPYKKIDRVGKEYVVITTSDKPDSVKISACSDRPYNF